MIKFAFQHWDDELAWWWPNTVPADYPNKGDFPTHGEQWRGEYEYLATCADIEKQLLSEIKPGEKYIFPVFIRDSHYFKRMENLGFDAVDRRVLADVKQGLAKIVLIFPNEGNSGYGYVRRDFEILDHWSTANKLNRDDVYFIHANRSTARASACNFTFIPIDAFICWVTDKFDEVSHFQPGNTHFLFLNYNRVSKVHRLLTTAYLIREKLLDLGLVSYYGDNTKNTLHLLDKFDRKDLHEEGLKIDNMIPRLIDMDLGKNNNPARNINVHHYRATFLSLISETHTDAELLFYSEKTWKTIAVGHPFMLIGSAGMLADLRSQGYKTFGQWWNEDYDNEPDLDSRIRLVVAELKRLSKMSMEELKQIRLEMQPTLEFNQRKFNERWQQECSTNKDYQLFEIVKNIWETF